MEWEITTVDTMKMLVSFVVSCKSMLSYFWHSVHNLIVNADGYSSIY